MNGDKQVMIALEIAASSATTIAIVLAGRNSIHTWWTGIVGCLFFALLFYQTQLYAEVLLQVFFIATCIFGWRHWRHGDRGQPQPVGRISRAQLLGFFVLGVIVAGIYGKVLHGYTDAFAPYPDSGILAFSVIGQLLMMRRQLECWIFWWLVNSIAVPLFLSRELYILAALYAGYWVHAIVAYGYWRRQWQT